MPTSRPQPGSEPLGRPPSTERDGPRPDIGQRVQTGQTTNNVAHKRNPRLPHERDESADSQDQQQPQQDEVMQQAHDDVERGLVDTDRGTVMDKVYNEKLKGDRR
ncbi:hypothetical protein OOT46_00730 [Aquabacterium sp. A7-Y]|uniref:hypothetical protein n=1 Tax=Aquabacterium sp. A7-Y TaxID=1349605 RepID=UPI00223E0133|nr:hypothetical protein [Aquabacterium sp. A7-Y]MCW7536378.1 hypothetical protein [Aquabacterium sp. A7-Y]